VQKGKGRNILFVARESQRDKKAGEGHGIFQSEFKSGKKEKRNHAIGGGSFRRGKYGLRFLPVEDDGGGL